MGTEKVILFRKFALKVVSVFAERNSARVLNKQKLVESSQVTKRIEVCKHIKKKG